MSDEKLEFDEILGGFIMAKDDPEAQTKRQMAANGVLPVPVQEMMKQSAYRLLTTSTDSMERHTAKLMISYSHWARERSKGILMANFEAFMQGQLELLNRQYPDPEKG